jgi:hypothetical protein
MAADIDAGPVIGENGGGSKIREVYYGGHFDQRLFAIRNCVHHSMAWQMVKLSL